MPPHMRSVFAVCIRGREGLGILGREDLRLPLPHRLPPGPRDGQRTLTPRADEVPEPVTESGTEETVDKWIEAAIGRAEPLRHRCQHHCHHVEVRLRTRQLAAVVLAQLYGVCRQPAEREEDDDYDEHL